MTTEQRYKIRLAGILGLFLILSFLIGIAFGELYMIGMLLIAFCAAFFIMTELYIRIQHNIERQIGSYQSNNGDKIDDIMLSLHKLIDFNEQLLQYLETIEQNQHKTTSDGKQSEISRSLLEEVQHISKLQNKIVVLYEQLLEYQEDQKRFFDQRNA